MSYQNTTEGMISMMRLLGLEPTRYPDYKTGYFNAPHFKVPEFHMLIRSDYYLWIGLGTTGIEMEMLERGENIIFQIYEIDELMELLS